LKTRLIGDPSALSFSANDDRLEYRLRHCQARGSRGCRDRPALSLSCGPTAARRVS
jgi:hypothetical protein